MKRINKATEYIFSIASITLMISICLGCSKVNFDDHVYQGIGEPTRGTILGTGPNCVEGKRLGIWLDRNDDGSTSSEPFFR